MTNKIQRGILSKKTKPSMLIKYIEKPGNHNKIFLVLKPINWVKGELL